jgi:putative transposase
VKQKLWGGEFWTDGYYVSTVSKHGDENVITNYVKSQGTEEHYKQLQKITDDQQPSLFD